MRGGLMMITEMFTAKKIGNCEIKNRFVVPAMVTDYCTEDGHITNRYIAYMEEKAKGGFGLLITEDFEIQEHGKGYPCIAAIYNDSYIEGCRKLTDAVHRHGAKIFCQLYHPGRETNHFFNGGVQPVAPSAIKDPVCQDLPRELTAEEIHQMVKDFGAAARRARKAGFDGVEIHAAHGYLIAQFLSPFVNRRTDEYGGCFDNRVRFLDEVYDEVRKNVGEDFPMQIRMSGNEYVLGGRTLAESLELAVHAEALGFDSIHVTNGVYAAPANKSSVAPMFTDHAFNMEIAEQIKRSVSIPVVVTNRINDPKMADIIVRMGKADFIGMGRGSIVDPYLPKKAKEGRFDEIKYCIGCLQGCMGGIFTGGCMTCLVNPSVGREYENNLKPAAVRKKVMVVGGGPAGLAAAEAAAKRGHEVQLFEAKKYLGGQFRAAAYPTGKGELTTVVSSYRRSLEVLNVPVHTETEVTAELVEKENPDAVILTTGATPLMPPIKGIDGKNVVTAEEVLVGDVDIPSGPVVVCGGGEVGCETAEFIAHLNPDVTVLEMKDAILNDMVVFTKAGLLELMQNAKIKILTGAKVSKIAEDSVTFEDREGKMQTVPATMVVSAFGYRSRNVLEKQLEGREVIVAGGAVKAGNAVAAFREGYEAGCRV